MDARAKAKAQERRRYLWLREMITRKTDNPNYYEQKEEFDSMDRALLGEGNYLAGK